MLIVRDLCVWVVRIGHVSSCEVLRELHKYVGCVLRSGLEELSLWWIFLTIPTALYRDHICLIPCCWWSCFRQKFDGKQCIIVSSILLWSWCRTFVFFSHSPSLSRFSPSVRSQSPVKVDVIAPLLCNKIVPSSVVRSRFLDVWHSHEKVIWSSHNSGFSSSICPSSVKSFPFLGMCSLHHFSAPISKAL